MIAVRASLTPALFRFMLLQQVIPGIGQSLSDRIALADSRPMALGEFDRLVS